MQRTMWTWLVVGASALSFAGCNGSSSDYKPAGELPQTADDHHHGHSEEGPHHGVLVELGKEEYHAEIVVDGKTHALRVYLLGPDGKTPVTTAATEITLTTKKDQPALTLKPAADQPAGEASVFELQDENVVHEIEEATFIHGTLTVKIGDKDFTSAVDAHFHDDHDHGHEKAATPKAE